MKSTYQLIKEKVKALEEENKRLNAALNKLEWFFHNREDYEWAELVRQVKVANIEWLENKGE